MMVVIKAAAGNGDWTLFIVGMAEGRRYNVTVLYGDDEALQCVI